MESLVTMLENKQLTNRYLGVFGSYTWSGGAFKGLNEFKENSKLEPIEPSIEVKGGPITDDIEKCKELGRNMAQKLQ
jgi:flavorubredoxin